MIVVPKQKVHVQINNLIETNFVRLPDSLVRVFEDAVLVQNTIVHLFPGKEFLGERNRSTEHTGTKGLYFGWDGYTTSTNSVFTTSSLKNDSSELPVVEINPVLYSALLGNFNWLAQTGNQPSDVYLEILNVSTVIPGSLASTNGEEKGNDVQVLVEPVDYDDYEVVENNIDFLSAQVLQQTRCVSVGQMFICHINKTFARFTVLKVTNKNGESLLSDQKIVHFQDGKKRFLKRDFIKLDNDVYIVVKPKVRLSKLKELQKSTIEGVKRRLMSTLRVSTESLGNTASTELYVYVKEKVYDYCWISHLPGPTVFQSFKSHQNANDKHKKTQDANNRKRKYMVKIKECSTLNKSEVVMSENLWKNFNLELNNKEFFEAAFVKDPKENVKECASLEDTIIIIKALNRTSLETLKIAKDLESFMQFQSTQIINNHEIFEIYGNLYQVELVSKEKGKDMEIDEKYVIFTKNCAELSIKNYEDKKKNNTTSEGPISKFALQVPKFHEYCSTKEGRYIGNTKLQETILNDLKKPISSTMFLYGKKGVGKTHFVKNLLNIEYNQGLRYCKYIDCEYLTGLKKSELSEWCLQLQSELYWYRDALIVLDNIEKLFPSADTNKTTEDSSGGVDKNLGVKVYFFINKLQDIIGSTQGMSCQTNTRKMTLLMTCEDKFKIHKYFTELKFITFEYTLKSLSKEGQLLFLSTKNPELNKDLKLEWNEIINYFDGFSTLDIINFIKMVEVYVEMETHKSEQNILDIVKKQYIPVNMKLQNVVPKPLDKLIGWDNVGGMFEVKQIILETLEKPVKYSKIFQNCPIRLRSGLLLYGYPGCGKTLIIKNIQTLFQSKSNSSAGSFNKLNFININGPEILNKYIGSSEKNIRDVFEKARSLKPCIIFFDEFDSIAPHRGHDSTGVTDRVVNQLLTELDGVEGGGGSDEDGGEGQVYVIAATSRPELIDAALLRPGRLDKSVLVDLPNMTECQDILMKSLQNYHHNIDTSDKNLRDVCAKLVDHHFTGADIQNIVYNAYLEAIHESTALDKEKNPVSKDVENQILLGLGHLLAVLKKSSSSISLSEYNKYSHTYSKFANRGEKDTKTGGTTAELSNGFNTKTVLDNLLSNEEKANIETIGTKVTAVSSNTKIASSSTLSNNSRKSDNSDINHAAQSVNDYNNGEPDAKNVDHSSSSISNGTTKDAVTNNTNHTGINPNNTSSHGTKLYNGVNSGHVDLNLEEKNLSFKDNDATTTSSPTASSVNAPDGEKKKLKQPTINHDEDVQDNAKKNGNGLGTEMEN
ncbi:hypothetical protein ACO0QE_003269 [Hanseniaspora vineae]